MLLSAGEELQALVDSAATEMGRPVGIDDRRFRPVAYSAHHDGFDAVRAECILKRASPEPAVRWIESLGLHTATELRRVPGRPALGMAPRVCVPLRYADHTIGFLWLIDEPDPLSAGELDAAATLAARASALLHRVRLLERQRRHREQLLIERVAIGAEGTRARAAAELVDGGYLERAAEYRVLAVRAGPPGSDGGGAMVDALERLRRTLPPRHLVAGEVAGAGLAVLACPPHEDVRRRAAALAQLARATGELPRPPVVGVSGGVRADELDRGWRQASDAAALGTDGVRGGDVVCWDDLGAYATILEARSHPEPLAAVPAALLRLLRSPEAAQLVDTLERYLEHGGDAAAAAGELRIHRSTLYARVRRIEDLTGTCLRSGDDRLTLHLGLRLWRLAGAPRA